MSKLQVYLCHKHGVIDPGLGICRGTSTMAVVSWACGVWREFRACASCIVGTQRRKVRVLLVSVLGSWSLCSGLEVSIAISSASYWAFICILIYQWLYFQSMRMTQMWRYYCECLCFCLVRISKNPSASASNMDIRPYELIAVATGNAVSIWRLEFPSDSQGRLSVTRVARLTDHNGEVCFSASQHGFPLLSVGPWFFTFEHSYHKQLY